MDVGARMTSKGRVTIPATVRLALDLHEGDELLFHVDHFDELHAVASA